MDDRLLETWNKLVDFWLKEYQESIVLYGQWPPPPGFGRTNQGEGC